MELKRSLIAVVMAILVEFVVACMCVCVSQSLRFLFSLEIGYLVIYFVLDSRTRDPKILYTPPRSYLAYCPPVIQKGKREGSHRIVTSSCSHLEMDEACDVRLQPRDNFASNKSLLLASQPEMSQKKDLRAEEMLSRSVSYWFLVSHGSWGFSRA